MCEYDVQQPAAVAQSPHEEYQPTRHKHHMHNVDCGKVTHNSNFHQPMSQI